MKPQDKAKKLLCDYLLLGLNVYKAKQCALILIDEIIEYSNNIEDEISDENYFNEVKLEIQKL